MKSLIPFLFAAAGLLAACDKEEVLPPTATLDTALARIEITVQGDSGGIEYFDSYGGYFLEYFPSDTVFVKEWEITKGCDYNIWCYNLGGSGDSVVVAKYYVDGVLDTIAASTSTHNTVSIYRSI